MCSLSEKFYQYGQKHDTIALQELMDNTSADELLDLIREKINSANFINLWNYILLSLNDSIASNEKRLKTILLVIKSVEERHLPTNRLTEIIQRICMDLKKMKSDGLVELCKFCLECIQSQNISSMGWRFLLPDLLVALAERESFYADETHYTGEKYKTEFINTLCMISWSTEIVTSLATVFIEIPLLKDEHLKLVNRFGSFIDKMTPQEIPPFLYQLLKLCKNKNGVYLFFKLDQYFDLHIYNDSWNINSESNSESPDLDLIESANTSDIIEAESTILYHINKAASLGYNCIKDYLNTLKNAVKAPESVLKPFHLLVLLTISTVSYYEEIVFDIIRSCIVRCFLEEQKKLKCLWFREMVSSNCKPEELFCKVVSESLEDRELVLQASVNFAFILLNVGVGFGKDILVERQWKMGVMILLKIIKRKSHMAQIIINNFTKCIISRQNAKHYIECLYILSTSAPLLMLENKSSIVELMESLDQVNPETASQLIDLFAPLVKISPSLRDHFILLLKKFIYSRCVETRITAVKGFLKIIENLKLSNYVVLSQSSSGSFSSGHSLLTQISLNRTSQTIGSSNFTNEGLCLEILSILKRCYMLQAEVRFQYYEGLCHAIFMNQELAFPILDTLWLHLSNFYVIDGELLPPLQFKKIAILRDTSSVLEEPIGKLIYTVSTIVSNASNLEEQTDNNSTVELKNVLDSLCERMAKCELIHFELDNGTDLLDILPESQQKMHILKEAMTVYEALIGYKVLSWSTESKDSAESLLRLYQGYSRLLDFSKHLSKSKKDKKSNAKTTQSQSITRTKKPEGQKLNQFKLPDTILNFQTVTKALKLLHEPTLSWVSVEQANLIKMKKEIHRHILQAALCLVRKYKNHKEIDKQTQKICFNNMTNIAEILNHRVLKTLSEFSDFDCLSCITAVECFGEIISLIISNYPSNFPLFLNKIVLGDQAKDKEIEHLLRPLVENLQKYFETDEDFSQDLEFKKLSLSILNTLSIIVSQIPHNTVLATQVYDWLKRIAQSKPLNGKPAGILIQLLFEAHTKYKVSWTLLDSIYTSLAQTLGVLVENSQTDGVKSFEIVHEETANSILLSLCNVVKIALEDVDIIIARLKSEYSMMAYSGESIIGKKQEHLKKSETGLTCQLCFIVAILVNITNTSVTPGSTSEAIFKNVILLFSSLSSLTKYFVSRSSKQNAVFQGARFEKLVKLAGKELAPAVYALILHIEESQKELQNKKTKKTRVESNTVKNRILRETKIIPKVIYEIEQFSKNIFQLSGKTKCDLVKHVGQGTVRDFRILQLKEVLQQADETCSTETDNNTTFLEESNEENENTTDEDSGSPPPVKRSKNKC